MGPLLEDGVVKYHPSFFVPRRWRRSQRCWEYPSKHRRDRCERRALLDYFKRGCFHHHVGQPDTPSGVLGFVLVLHLMLFQQPSGIHIQMFDEPVYRHIRLNRLGQLGGTAFLHSRFAEDTIFATASSTGSGDCFQSSFSAWSRPQTRLSWSLLRYNR